MKNSTTFPETISHKGCTAAIYRSRHRGKYRYEVRCNAEGRMERLSFKTYAQARTFAIEALRRIAESRTALVSLHGVDAVEYLHARELLGGKGLKLLEAVKLAVDLTTLVGERSEPRQAVREWLEQQPPHSGDIRVAEVVQEFLKSKNDGAEIGDYHRRDLRCRLGAFARHFDCPIRLISRTQLNDYIQAGTVAPRTRRNVRNTLNNLFNFARTKGYLGPKHPGVPKLPGRRKLRGEVGVFTPEELVELLAVANPKVALPMAITAFGGIRAAELSRLEWRHVNLAERHIEVPGVHAKTKLRRLVPITENLLAWLNKFFRHEGRICEYHSITNQYLKAAKRAGIEWKRNGLRHSFVSYRVADIANISQVAIESGNSPQVIQTDYLKVVTKKQARRWFSIYPDEGVREPTQERSEFRNSPPQSAPVQFSRFVNN